MKIVRAQEMARIEKLAYAEGASEEQFMNQAGVGVAELVQRAVARYHAKPSIALLCGSGNNAGDAFVAGRILLEGGFKVFALSLATFEKSSQLCQVQSKRFMDCGGSIQYIKDEEGISFGDAGIIIDGILGTGFHGEVSGMIKTAIKQANASNLPIISIDIPSGINGTTGEIGGVAIQAAETLFLGLPKIGCFFEEAWNCVGNVNIYNFGLDQQWIDKAESDYELIEDAMMRNFLPKIRRTRHKYQSGYVVGVGGCKGMPGAPIMASIAALRTGAGIVRLLHPEGMEAELSSAPFEIIRQSYPEDHGATIKQAVQRASALFFGPGMGNSLAAQSTLQSVLDGLDKPCVIDADALNLIAELSIPFPSQTLITPHHGEMKKLLKIKNEISFKQLLEMSNAYAQEKKIVLILKGAPTYIFYPAGKPLVCPRGNPGMATAGSGDILTGIAAAFLAQTHDVLKAAVLAVQIHAIAGEQAASTWTSYCMIATDILEALPYAFKEYMSFRTHN